MPGPVDPGAMFLRVVGRFLGAVQVRAYTPRPEGWADGVGCPGVRGPRRVEWQETGESGGRVRVTRATWWLHGPTIGGRPPLKSLVVDGSESWVIDSFAPDQQDAVLACECTLKG